MNSKWISRCINSSKAVEIAEKNNISLPAAQILVNRNILSEAEIKRFLNPSLEYMHDPFLMKDMDLAVDRILEAIDAGEKIVVYGDYDVDGVTSSYILSTFLEKAGGCVECYIPNRFQEGYGLNKQAIEALSESETSLIVTVDCGITSIEEVEYARQLGIDMVITDHHQCKENIPEAVAVINPHREDCEYPFKELCGAGVAFKLCYAINMTLGMEDENILELMEIAAIGTVADIVQLRDENRIIVNNGLARIRNTQNIGLQALMKVAGIDCTKINSYTIGFGIGPRINAAGRIESASEGLKLLKSTDMQEATKIATELNNLNMERQAIEKRILEEAIEMIESTDYLDKYKVIVLEGKDWHSGVVGIVASRIVERYYLPTILLCNEGDMSKGSARSIEGFDMFGMLQKADEEIHIEKFGGHYHAAGLTIDSTKVDTLREKLSSYAENEMKEEDFIPKVYIDYSLKTDDISLQTHQDLSVLEPFGMGNPKPCFQFNDALIYNIRKLGASGDTLKITLQKDGQLIETIGFKKGYLADSLEKGAHVDICCTVDKNEWNGNERLQLIISDIRICDKKDLIEKFYFSLAERVLSSKLSDNDIYKTKNNKFDIDTILSKPGNSIVVTNNLEFLLELNKILNNNKFDIKNDVEFCYNIVCELEQKKSITVLVNPIEEINYGEYQNVYEIYKDIDKSKIICDKNYLRAIYKFLIKEHEIGNNFNISDLAYKIYRDTKQVTTYFKTYISVSTFKEIGLIADDKVLIPIKAESKKDLFASESYTKWAEWSENVVG